jgi:hypothetical protein
MIARARGLAPAAACLAALALAGCEGGPIPEQDLAFEPLQGEWIGCLTDGAGDYTRHVVFFPDASFSTTTRRYATTDGSCAGAETGVSHAAWRYGLLGDVPSRIGADGRDVLARQMDAENSADRVFTIVYVDREAVPAVLYFGDLVLDPVEDGTAPDRRPDVLSVATALTSQ